MLPNIKRDRLRIIGAVVVACLTGGALVVPLARGGNEVDCSGLKPWSASHGGYRKGERVWVKVARYADGAEYSCSDSPCFGDPEKTSQWSIVGECKHNTAPH